FPLYLINEVESKQEIAAKVAPNVFVVHTGHILKPNFTKEQNEEILKSLSEKNIDLVNLTVEDFTIAANQEIALNKYPQKFLSSSIIDINEDSFIAKTNITPYIIHEGVAFIGLSDKNLTLPMVMDKFLVSDYVLAVLRAKKLAFLANPKMIVKSYVIVHTIGSDIGEVMERLPPNFINSLAN
ncbi:MAG: hypothetical protein K2Q18_12865, partial [Bdellovibrionales bacterium]|nr:hypothetical protein [Bdellovibrionales bacterium]